MKILPPDRKLAAWPLIAMMFGSASTRTMPSFFWASMPSSEELLPMAPGVSVIFLLNDPSGFWTMVVSVEPTKALEVDEPPETLLLALPPIAPNGKSDLKRPSKPAPPPTMPEMMRTSVRPRK